MSSAKTSTESRVEGAGRAGRGPGSAGGGLCSLGWGRGGREAQGLVTDTDTAVLILDIYLVWWGGEGGRGACSGDGRHPEYGSG